MSLIKAGNDSGGRDAINSLLRPTISAHVSSFAEHLDVSKSTMANRYLRDSFPAEWVIHRALRNRNRISSMAGNRPGDMYASENEERISKTKPPSRYDHLIF